MMFAFSRDRAVPGHRLWTRLNHHRVPAYAVLGSCAAALIVTLPALEGDENAFPYAFFAVVSITVIGLYIAYVMPTYLRWRMGDTFEPGPWTLGRKYKWVNPAAILWVAICVVIFILPFNPAGVPWRDEFDWKYVNYAPITVGGVLLIVGLWWTLRAKHTFTGPVRNIEFDGQDTYTVHFDAPLADPASIPTAGSASTAAKRRVLLGIPLVWAATTVPAGRDFASPPGAHSPSSTSTLRGRARKMTGPSLARAASRAAGRGPPAASRARVASPIAARLIASGPATPMAPSCIPRCRTMRRVQ